MSTSWSPRRAANIPSFEEEAPVFGETSAWTPLACADWPVRADHPVPRRSTAQVRRRSSWSAPPATRRPRWSAAEALAEQLDSGVLLTRDGDGHTAYGMGNACIDDAIEGYLVDGAVPADGTDC